MVGVETLVRRAGGQLHLRVGVVGAVLAEAAHAAARAPRPPVLRADAPRRGHGRGLGQAGRVSPGTGEERVVARYRLVSQTSAGVWRYGLDRRLGELLVQASPAGAVGGSGVHGPGGPFAGVARGGLALTVRVDDDAWRLLDRACRGVFRVAGASLRGPRGGGCADKAGLLAPRHLPRLDLVVVDR